MNYPAASSGVSIKDLICLIVASDEVLDLALRNKKDFNTPKAHTSRDLPQGFEGLRVRSRKEKA